ASGVGRTEGAGDAVVCARDGAVSHGRFRFAPKDGAGRFAIYTPSGQLAVTIDGNGDVILGHPSPGDLRQLWRWDEAGRLINGHGGRAATFARTAQTAALSARPPAGGAPTAVRS